MQSENPMRFFSENVDNWGAVEWFDRAAKAIRSQDKAVVEGDEVAAETYRMIAASSLMTLVRDHEATVRIALEAALSAAEPVGEVGEMPGSNGGFTMAAFKAADVPIGAKLYIAPPAPSVAVKALEWDESQNHAYNSAFGYQIAVIGDRVVLRCPLSASSEHENIQAAKEAANEHHLARIVPALSAQVQDVVEERYRHKKRGSTYVVTARGRLQVDGDLDNEKVVVYRGEDGQTWVRPEYEFNDGRFEPLPAAPAKQEGGE